MPLLEPYTVTMTSCGRFDLLERTLRSLLPRLEGQVVKFLIVEDSGNGLVEKVVERVFDQRKIEVQVIINSSKYGQVRSIDQIFSRVDTKWVFHCEDDWEFIHDGFISESFKILKGIDNCSMVILHNFDHKHFNKKHVERAIVTKWGTANYQVATVGEHGYLFGPGLRRMRDYQIVGPFGKFGPRTTEAYISRLYRNLGYRVVSLTQQTTRHLGDDRHLVDPIRRPNGMKKHKLSLTKRVNRLHWKINPSANPVNRIKNRFEREKQSFSNWIDFDHDDHLLR